MKSLKNKVIWITGASSGIGRALAIALSHEKARLVLSARDINKLNSVQEICLKFTDSCMVLPFDISNKSEIEEATKNVIQTYGNIDILINNAGRSQRSLAKETDVEIDRLLMETNFFGAVTLSKSILPHMLKQKQGHIVAVSSITGKFGFPWRTGYCAAKHALQGYFEALRTELRNDNIHITIISPGRISTQISEKAITKDGQNYNILDQGQKNGMTTEACAEKIIKAIKRNKKDVLVGKTELLMVYIHKFFPWLFYHLSAKIKN